MLVIDLSSYDASSHFFDIYFLSAVFVVLGIQVLISRPPYKVLVPKSLQAFDFQKSLYRLAIIIRLLLPSPSASLILFIDPDKCY